MRRLFQGWLLFGCVLAAGQVSVRESATRARLVEEKTTIALAVTNRATQPLAANIEIQYLDVEDRTRGLARAAVTLAPGDSVVDVPAALSETADPLTLRVRYRVSSAEKNYTAFTPEAGVLDFLAIADYAFALTLAGADRPRPGKPFEVHALAAHPLTGRPVSGVALRCGKATAVSDASGLGVLRVIPAADEERPAFEVEGQRGDYVRSAKLSTIIGLGSVRIDTDRPLYQPGQTMHVRILETAASGRAREGAKDTIRILDDDDETVHVAQVVTSRFGVASTDWEIPANAPGGKYHIEVKTDQFETAERTSVIVRPYELPSFRVVVTPERPYYLRRESAVVDVRAEYLFGKPVAAGAVRIVEDDDDKAILEGPLDAAGRFRGTIATGEEPEDDDGDLYVDRRFTVFLTDASTNRTEQRKFDLRVSRDSLHLYEVRTEYTPEGRRLYASCFTPEGAAAACELQVRDEDGGVIGRGRTNRFGLGRVDLPAAGDEKVTVRATAPGGRGAEREAEFLRYEPWIWLGTDRALYRPGSPVKCRIAAERDGAAALLAWNEAGEMVFARGLRLERGQAELEIPYDRRFGRRLSLAVASSGSGYVVTRVAIFPGGSDLALRAIPGRAEYRPGETARIAFQASAEAALGVAIVDQSVLERAATDGAPRRNLFDKGDSGRSIGGIGEREMMNLDPAGIDDDLNLIAEALESEGGLWWGFSDPQKERIRQFSEAERKTLQPVGDALTQHYLQTLEQPRNEASLHGVAGWRMNSIRDHWGMPFTARFATERDDHVLRLCSAGPDKRPGTSDDFCPLEMRRPWFAREESLIRERLRALTAAPGSPEELVRVLEEGGLRFGAFRDPWGGALRVEVAYRQERRLIQVYSAGPDRAPETIDDFLVAMFDGPYFTVTERKIREALNAAAVWPRTEEAVRSVIEGAHLEPGAFTDPWGRTYYLTCRARDAYTDRVEFYSYAEYQGVAERRREITPVKRTTLIVEIRSRGEDGIRGNYDDFPVAVFERPLDTAAPARAQEEAARAPAQAPGAAGAIAGVVTDATGALIVGARVTLNGDRVVLTDELGRYEFRGAPPGVFQLEFSASGFLRSVTVHVPVKADRITRVDKVLEVGAAFDAIYITAAVPRIQSEMAMLAGVSERPVSTPRVREYFPETLYWQPELITDANGRAWIDVKMADSITNWKLEAIGSTVDGRIAFASADIRAFQPFLADLDVPRTLTVGDEIDLPVPVRNYLDRAQEVKVQAAVPPALSLRRAVRQPERIEASSSASAVLALRAGASAESARVRVTALGRDASDAIEKPVSIHPDGHRREYVLNAIVQPGQPLRFEVPETAIAGSLRAEVKIFPSPLARILASMEALLTRPYGCGEQTISSTYPNLLLLDALKKAGLQSAPLEAKARKNLAAGYQRLLGYQDASGGFKYWSTGEPMVALTAYALEFLAGAGDYLEVDRERVKKAQAWLARQDSRELTNRAVRARGLIRTQALDSHALEELLGEMAREALVNDPYPVASFALAALEAGKRELARPAIGRLMAMAQDERGAAFWALQANTPFHGWGRAGQVETTALVLSALTRWRKAGGSGGELDALIDRGSLFLIRGADASGAWSSGQATVRALMALLETWSGDARREAATVRVRANGASAGGVTIPGGAEAAGPLTLDLSKLARTGANEVALEGAGSRTLQVQVNAAWYEPWDQPRTASKEFSFEVRFDKTKAAIQEAVACDVRVSRPSFRGYGMMIAEVGLPPGAEVDRGSLESLLGRIDSYEVAPDRVTFYLWPRAADMQFRFLFRPRFAIEARAGQSTLYDYYNPDARVTLAPETFTVK